MNPAIVDLCGSVIFPELVRAHNSRQIMGNVVPDSLEDDEARPYCV